MNLRRKRREPRTVERTLLSSPILWAAMKMMPDYIVYIEDKRWIIALKGSESYLEIFTAFMGEQSSLPEVI